MASAYKRGWRTGRKHREDYHSGNYFRWNPATIRAHYRGEPKEWFQGFYDSMKH